MKEWYFEKDLYFGFDIPTTLSSIDPSLLDPLKAWDNIEQYHDTAKELVKKFQHNYEQYDLGDDMLRSAGPKIPE